MPPTGRNVLQEGERVRRHLHISCPSANFQEEIRNGEEQSVESSSHRLSIFTTGQCEPPAGQMQWKSRRRQNFSENTKTRCQQGHWFSSNKNTINLHRLVSASNAAPWTWDMFPLNWKMSAAAACLDGPGSWALGDPGHSSDTPLCIPALYFELHSPL